VTLKRACYMALLVLPCARSAETPKTDEFTPVVASPLSSSTSAFPGTDGKQHVVYELLITNTLPTPATLRRIEVIDPGKSSAPVAKYEGTQLLSHLRTLDNSTATGPDIEFNGTRLFLIDLALESRPLVPGQLHHRLGLLAASRPGPQKRASVPLSYTIAPLRLNSDLREIGAPVRGKGWVVVNGCCEVSGIHRSTGLPVNGGIHFAQRFAIDWMRLDSSGRMVNGNASDVHSYPNYNADVLAVADGTVVATLNNLDDQMPGKLPDPSTITLANVDGNHIVMDLGRGVFAFYAHLKKGSVRVTIGQRVRRGEVVANLGNTGNTSAPHLHFHLMDNPSVLGSSGLPYVIDRFTLSGRISAGDFKAAEGLEGIWSKSLSVKGSPRQKEFPVDGAIVDFAPVDSGLHHQSSQ
jgi:hypothetical protein